MKVLLAHDSQSETTTAIAQQMKAALLQSGTVVETAHVDDIGAARLWGNDLVFLGGSTHRRRPTAEMVAFLDSLAPGLLRNVRIAAFETKDQGARRLSGAAARRIAIRVRRAGAVIVGVQSFLIPRGSETLGPVALERAAAWARSIAEANETSHWVGRPGPRARARPSMRRPDQRTRLVPVAAQQRQLDQIVHNAG